jgi:hypothetical protein
MARAMASPLRVKNTAYFDIATTSSANAPLHCPLAGGDATDKRAEPVRAAISVRQRIPLVEPSRSALLEAPNLSDRVRAGPERSGSG